MTRAKTHGPKVLAILILASTLAACSGGGGSSSSGDTGSTAGGAGTGGGSPAPAPPPAINPQPTAVGTAIGTPVTQTIGAGGGTVATADGAVALTIPPGALAADTVVGIQPISNNAIHGVGSAYRLTPEGTSFAKPVQLSFTYTDALVAGSAPQALLIATQDGTGVWQIASPVTLDTAARTVSLSIPHFSDWSLIQGIQLVPGTASVRPGGRQVLTVDSCDTASTIGAPGDAFSETVYDCGADLSAPLRLSNWSVNGVAGGSAATGTVGPTSGAQAGTYTAPSTIPADPAVAVSVDAAGAGRSKTTLVSRINIVQDAYGGTLDIPAGDYGGNWGAQHVDITWTRANPDPLDVLGGATYYGTGTWSAKLTPTGCDPVDLTADLLDRDSSGNALSVLEIYGAGTPLAGKYRFQIFTKAQLVNLTCYGQPAPTKIAQNILIDECPSDSGAGADAPGYTDPSLLTQSTAFKVATGAPADPCRTTMTATWNFTPK